MTQRGRCAIYLAGGSYEKRTLTRRLISVPVVPNERFARALSDKRKDAPPDYNL
jgi:hypothetical protein